MLGNTSGHKLFAKIGETESLGKIGENSIKTFHLIKCIQVDEGEIHFYFCSDKGGMCFK